MAKIHIVGAGPAGSIAAISALSAGHEVSVSEEHPRAGVPRNCSGLFSVDGLRSLSRFISPRRHAINKILGARIDFAGTELIVRRKRPVALVCDRSGMDESLASLAESKGALIAYGERIRGRFKSNHIIGADGPLSGVAIRFGFPRIRHFASTLQARVRLRSEEPGMIRMHLSNARYPGFFGWVIPQDEDTAEIGVGVELPSKPLDAWRHLLRQAGVQSAPRPSGFVIPLSPRPATSVRAEGRTILLAGDAAGQVKSTTGGGVIFGGQCAEIAGRYASSPRLYELEWRRRFMPDILMHRAVHRWLGGLSDEGLARLGRRLKKLNIEEYLSHHGHMDRPTKMLRLNLAAHVLKNILGVA